MSANQINATGFNPNQLNLTKVSTYEREIQAPIERVWENVLDWEHLPWLHHTSFDYVELDEGGDWGWRTWSDPAHQSHVELTRANEDSYVARSYREGDQISEIWTHLSDLGETTGVSVEFHITDVADDAVEAVGAAMLKLYTRLWDEDEAMMTERHQRLLETRETASTITIGDAETLQEALAGGEVIVFQLGRKEFKLTMTDGTFSAHSTICPHLLGPLESADNPKELFCPWHGYRFDRESGDCVYPADASCRLSRPPELSIVDGALIASFKSSS